jgi:hypothetical protein
VLKRHVLEIYLSQEAKFPVGAINFNNVTVTVEIVGALEIAIGMKGTPKIVRLRVLEPGHLTGWALALYYHIAGSDGARREYSHSVQRPNFWKLYIVTTD